MCFFIGIDWIDALFQTNEKTTRKPDSAAAEEEEVAAGVFDSLSACDCSYRQPVAWPWFVK